MPKFKVVNPDAPEEIDFYQDIPLIDPDTGTDQLDSEGNILVKRYVNHTVSIKGINEIKDALPAIKTNTQNLEELYQYSHAQNEAQQIAINENSNAIVDLQTSTSEMALDLETLTNKINGIQGIDIDELKDYVYTQVPLIKNSYLPLVGGTITGNVTVEEGTITGSLTGVASNATADVNNKELTSYIADIMGANAQLSIIKGDGTTSVLSINNVLKATNADNLGSYPASDYVRSVNGVTTDTSGNVQLGNLGAITGKIEWFAFNTPPEGYLVCNGAEISRETYADLFAVIGTLYGKGDGINATSKFGTAVLDGEDSNSIRVTVATNESDASSFDVTTYFKDSLVETQTVKNATELANNSYIVWDTSVALVAGDDVTFTGGIGTTFTLPNLIDKFAQGSTTVGTYMSAGLPNITGSIGTTKPNSVGSGAFKTSKNGHEGAASISTGKVMFYATANFDASDSNSIYGNSTTVQPPALTLLPCIKY